MNSKKTLFTVALVAVMMLSSCSGLNNRCTTNCGGGGNASLSVTISDTPPTNTTVVSFTLPVIGITLTPSSGSAVSIFSSNPSTNYELTRLQSDTNLVVANKSIAAGTYKAVNVTVAAPFGVFVNASGATVGACVAGAYCGITGNTATVTYTFPTALTLTANTNQYLNLDFNYNNAVVLSNNVLAIDVTQTGVMTASSAVPAGVTSGSFANIDDFIGAITALSSSSITVQSSVRGSMTAAISSSTPWYDPLGQCSGGGSAACVGVGSIVSMQALLSNAGAVTATSMDIIDKATAPSDEVEGIIYPSTCNGGNNYGMILSDSTIFTSSSPLTGAEFGTGVCLTLSQATTFAIDTEILTGQAGVPLNNLGFQGTGDIRTGQTVRAKVTNAAAGTNGLVNANATALILRFSRMTATVATAGTAFTVNGLPTYLGTFNVPPQVQTYLNATLLEGLTDTNSLQNGQTVSFRALYVDTVPTFHAAKVRLQ